MEHGCIPITGSVSTLIVGQQPMSCVLWLHTSQDRRNSDTFRGHIQKLEESMKRIESPLLVKVSVFILMLASVGAIGGRFGVARAQSQANVASDSDRELIAQFRRVEVASVSDAIEQIMG